MKTTTTFALSDTTKVKQTTLENGLRIITVAWPHVKSVKLGIWVNTGSSSESAEDNGITHFLEHMPFNGTQKRSSLQIREDIENTGGELNACTSKDYTCYNAWIIREYLEVAVDILADFIMAPTLAPEEINREKEVVIQEIKRAEDIPPRVLSELSQQAAFPNQALSRSVLGTPENIRAFDRERIVRYRNAHYTADNMVVIAVGQINHDSFVAMVEKRMGTLPRLGNRTAIAQHYVGGCRIKYQDMAQTLLSLGFKGVSSTDDDYYRYVALSKILGGCRTSRLWQKVRQERGLAYSVGCSLLDFSNAGILRIVAGTTPQQLRELLQVIAAEIKKLITGSVSETELKRAKTQMKADLLQMLENPSSLAGWIAWQALQMQRIIPMDEAIDRIEAITAADLQQMAQKVFTSAPTYALLGCKDGDYPDYDELKALLQL